VYISCKGDKNDKIIWSDANKMKFDELIKALLEKPYLHLRKDDLPLIMVVDASSIAVGGYIYQQQDSERLILGHFCCILGKCLKARSPTYLELKAISVGVETFKDLVCGKTLYVHSDHRPLKSLLNSKSITQPKHMELLCTIKQYVTEIIYIPGSQNCIADYISRCTSANEGGSDKILKEINFVTLECRLSPELTEMIKNDQINLETYCGDKI
uniref:RT_RNaseH_2 domain-containing protein n=1 Tax=Strongyloides papillosus TaxID=174720 RepID=A0A0N5C3F8_STREA